MKQITLIAIALMTFGSGCSMCCGPFDYDYPSFGGKHPRADRSYGRVGSIFSDPLTTLSGAPADSNLGEHPQPSDSSIEDQYDSLGDPDDNLEGIEPLRDQETLKQNKIESTEDSTASTRWRPKPLR